MELKEQLIRGAIGACGCAEGVAQLDGAAGKSEMVQCYLDHIDFCLARNFPDKEFLKRHFRKELKEKGIYADETVELYNTHAVLLGNSEGVLRAGGYGVCRLYIKHSSQLRIEASGNAFVMADVLDEAGVEVICLEKAKVVVNLYARASARGQGEVKIIHKNKDTYDL